MIANQNNSPRVDFVPDQQAIMCLCGYLIMIANQNNSPRVDFVPDQQANVAMWISYNDS